MDPTLDEAELICFDECTAMTRTHLCHDIYGTNYVCDVHYNAHMSHLGVDVNATDNTYHLSPNILLLIRIMRPMPIPPMVNC